MIDALLRGAAAYAALLLGLFALSDGMQAWRGPTNPDRMLRSWEAVVGVAAVLLAVAIGCGTYWPVDPWVLAPFGLALLASAIPQRMGWLGLTGAGLLAGALGLGLGWVAAAIGLTAHGLVTWRAHA